MRKTKDANIRHISTMKKEARMLIEDQKEAI
jgi:hypothetical protein